MYIYFPFSRSIGEYEEYKFDNVKFCGILIGILTYVFLSQPYQDYIYSIGPLTSTVRPYSRYYMIGNYFTESGAEFMMALANLIVAILAGLIILISLYSLLVNFGVIKLPNTLLKTSIISITLSAALIIFTSISLFCIVGTSDGQSFSGNGLKVGWSVIVNFRVSFLFLIISMHTFLVLKNKKIN